ncbi:hypothetical protein QC762_500020 [Podospora pseudocomata]|uniref:Uncharacterized protein n=1 Tax=Podospora pseudocomata TaxID=2093779 RepID=A0ABR0GAL6_9PEZI|nr:hypothetical protein QC762_500020 [Podospora pseudocomata]
MDSPEGEFDGNDFANNLFSDLAPLLTLFGEQVTKQFLSMSVGWADNVLLAMGPLGILTIVVSAIRVAGETVPNLKALIGRAREDRASVEVELLSSTSREVCELWTGTQIVRVRGQPLISQPFIMTDTGNVYPLWNDVAQGTFEVNFMAKDWDRETSLLAKVPPNLGLNISGAIPSNREMWMWAALGTVLQLASLVVSGTVTYRWNLAQVEVPTTTYGYPCYLVGSLLLTLGVLLCGHIVEAVSKERTFRCKAKMRKRVRIFRIQLAATVNDQHFDSYLIFNSPENPDVYASFYQGMKKNTRYYAIAGSALSFMGFITQFIGLRGLHWSAAVIQLAATLVMTVFRAYVRRGLAKGLPAVLVNTDLDPALTLAVNVAKWHTLESSIERYARKKLTGLNCESLESLGIITGGCKLWYQSGRVTGNIAVRHEVLLPKSTPPTGRQLPHLSTSIRIEGKSPGGAATEQGTEVHALLTMWENASFLHREQSAASSQAQILEDAIWKIMAYLEESGRDPTPLISWKKTSPFLKRASQSAECGRLIWGVDCLGYRSPKDGNGCEPLEATASHVYSTEIPLAVDYPTTKMRDILEALLSISSCGSQPFRMARIIGTQLVPSDNPVQGNLARWLGSRSRAGNMNGIADENDYGMGWGLCWGMYLSPLAKSHNNGNDGDTKARTLTNDDSGEERIIIVPWPKASTGLESYAQELFSLFLLAIAEHIEKVNGVTENLDIDTSPASKEQDGYMYEYQNTWQDVETPPRSLENSVFEGLVDIAVETGICTTRKAARILIIPAFAWHGLLPEVDSTSTVENKNEASENLGPVRSGLMSRQGAGWDAAYSVETDSQQEAGQTR